MLIKYFQQNYRNKCYRENYERCLYELVSLWNQQARLENWLGKLFQWLK